MIRSVPTAGEVQEAPVIEAAGTSLLVGWKSSEQDGTFPTNAGVQIQPALAVGGIANVEDAIVALQTNVEALDQTARVDAVVADIDAIRTSMVDTKREANVVLVSEAMV